MTWKEIKDFPGYEISDQGEVKSTRYWGQFRRKSKDGTLVLRTDKSGYKYVNLYKKGHMYSVKVHRLVAVAFVPNPNNLPVVNHIDEDKGNNKSSNLEWCTQRHNMNHKDIQVRAHSKQKKAIIASDADGNLSYYDSLTSAALHMVHLGKAKAFKSALSNISNAANNANLPQRYGHIWKWYTK